jgi:hypothetical protein
MTSIRLPTPIDPNKTYPVLWYWNGLRGGGCIIKEMLGSVLLDSSNPEHTRYTNVKSTDLNAGHVYRNSLL